MLDTALKLFREQSFDAVTLEMICRESAISKRSFFRYFRDKEALIFPHREERLAIFRHFLLDHQQSQSPFDTLRLATQVFGAQHNDNREHLLAQQDVIQSSPALLAREKEIDRDWEHEIAIAFSARAGNEPKDDLWARVIAGAIMGVVRATVNYWFEHDGAGDLAELGLSALDRVERGFPARES